jgi:type IV pilus assembly protein PilM
MHATHKGIEDTFSKLFPPPAFLTMPAVGIDLTDHSVRYLELGYSSRGKCVRRFGQQPVSEGALQYGEIKDRSRIVSALRELARREKMSFVHCSLPEEKAYLFKIDVPSLSPSETKDQISFQLEENVPLKAADTVFDYAIVCATDESGRVTREAVVSVYPKKVIEEFLALFEEAGMIPLSFEMEANAIARAVIPKGDNGCYMIVDFGQQRTGLSIVDQGVVQFASTVDVGGHILTAAIQKQFNVSPEEADIIKREETFVSHGAHHDFFLSLMNSIAALGDEINKHYIYWHTHTDKKGRKQTPIKKIILTGADANLGGLPEHLSLTLKTKVELANVWTNILSLEDRIPPLTFASSLSYATAVGLALRSL